MLKSRISMQLTDGNSYILRNKGVDSIVNLLKDYPSKGYRIVYVTRTYPAEYMLKFNIKINFIWLSTQKDKEFQTATNLGELNAMLTDYMKKKEKVLFVFDRIEYPITLFSFDNLIKFLYELNDSIILKKHLMLILLDSSLLNPSHVDILEKEFITYIPSIDKEDILAEDLRQIMLYLQKNENASFKDITKTFNITKTTTRKRIVKLLEYNLISINKNGRNKILKLTEKAYQYI